MQMYNVFYGCPQVHSIFTVSRLLHMQGRCSLYIIFSVPYIHVVQNKRSSLLFFNLLFPPNDCSSRFDKFWNFEKGEHEMMKLWKQQLQLTHRISSYKALPWIISAFLIMPAPGTLLWRWNLVISNENFNWRPYEKNNTRGSYMRSYSISLLLWLI